MLGDLSSVYASLPAVLLSRMVSGLLDASKAGEQTAGLAECLLETSSRLEPALNHHALHQTPGSQTSVQWGGHRCEALVCLKGLMMMMAHWL